MMLQKLSFFHLKYISIYTVAYDVFFYRCGPSKNHHKDHKKYGSTAIYTVKYFNLCAVFRGHTNPMKIFFKFI